MNLIVVESPTKARTLNRFLGKGYHVEATMGHIKDLPKSKLAVDVEKNFKPDYVIVEKREKEIKKLKDQAKKAKEIFLATDPDREGEAIAQHICDVLRSNLSADKVGDQLSINNDQFKRIVFHEITKEAVEEAIKNPRKVDKNLVNAQIARRVLDRLVGYKLSPLLWKKVRRGLSAGRVQTVTVRLIVEREKEIKAFKAEEYWEIYVNLKTSKTPKRQIQEFIVKLIEVNDKKAEVKDGESAKTIVNDLEKADYSVFDINRKEVRKNPYPPFTTSTLTQAAANLFYWSSKKCMSVAQMLYEQGLITYHRTDSTNIASQAISKVRNFIKDKYGENYLPENPRVYKTRSKVAQEAHEAVRPTNVNSKFKIQSSKFEKDAEKLYGLIWKRFVACQMAQSVYDQTTIDVLASLKLKAESSRQYSLRASGQIMKFDGWRKVFGKQKENGEVILPDVEADEKLNLIKVDPQQKFTQPPARFTEASLIKTLEKLGIGRPSTYAPTISTIRVRNYVEKVEGAFLPTSIGVAVNDFLIANFPKVFDYDFTAQMEDDLDNVANGEEKWPEMIGEFYTPFGKKLTIVEKKAKRVKIEAELLGRKCPKCKSLPAGRQGELVIRVGRFGKFISCSKFPDCDYKEKYVEKIGMKCPDCKKSLPANRQGDVIVKTTGKGRKFYGCSRYPDCKWANWKDPRKDRNQN